ncbi:MAG: shikimate dehydrogenase [Bacteroidia bacterium]|nr:shikimate dehydrogenase [Bacteroidia bacterium]
MSYFGLIGFPLSHSFSQKIFQQQFGEAHQYDLLPCETISQVESRLKKNHKYSGFNVTIPYKEQVINLLDELSMEASEIKAVNTILVEKSGRKVGYNTDSNAFKITLLEWLPELPKSAIILGGGGASKAVAYALRSLGVPFSVVERKPHISKHLSYSQLNQIGLGEFELIVNTTPCGMHPNVSETPPILLNQISANHKVYDLIYNPHTTALMQSAADKKAATLNGINMLKLQAKIAWNIWGLTNK